MRLETILAMTKYRERALYKQSPMKLQWLTSNNEANFIWTLTLHNVQQRLDMSLMNVLSSPVQ